MIDDALLDAADRMEKALEALQRDLASVRTGRASPALVDHIQVDYYGTPTPLNQLATVTTPDARLIVIQPWDRGSIGAVEKAIQKSDLGLNPSNDGTVIRLALPQLTEDRRREIAKQVRKRVEDARVAARNVRRDCHDQIRRLEHDHKISQDDMHRAETELQKLTDDHIKGIDKAGHAKEEEVLAV
ncbi:MAG: ribosome recycling factor [Chloroflexi bacterium RBG_16_64_32]|nr:MAG: ribosome recycling factor [Chloroflexi bacterium RBG_16_64_32]